MRASTVRFRGVSGISHSVDVDAETVYEAGIRASPFYGGTDVAGPGAELEIRVREPETTDQVRVSRLRHRCDSVTVSPAETLRKAKLKQVLGTYGVTSLVLRAVAR